MPVDLLRLTEEPGNRERVIDLGSCEHLPLRVLSALARLQRDRQPGRLVGLPLQGVSAR